MRNLILKSNRINIIFFLLFSLFSGFVELGNVFWAIDNNYSILSCIGLGLAYQIGNLVPVPIKLNKTVNLMFVIISLCLTLIYIFICKYYFFFFIITILTAMCIQNVRSIMKDSISTTVKRSFRILGFVLAPVCYNEKVLLFIISLILLVTIIQHNEQRLIIEKCKVKTINLVMIVHQMHYFSYVYFIICIMVIQNTNLGKIVYGSLFALSWLTYIVMPHVLQKDTYAKYFIIGHSFLTLTLICMFLFRANPLIILFWILTGFGGGTVFCIGKINNSKEFCAKIDLTFSENIGHILGVIGGGLSFIITNNIYSPIIFSSVCAILAMSGMLFCKNKYMLK